ncbi:MAG: hypothetical protein ACJASF_000521 [Vicingaceae bacterium]|jgi:hypothetical protein
MTEQFQEKELSDKTKNIQPLTVKQKFLFGMLCWGIHSWSQAESFKTNGYEQKYKDARTSMRTGLIIYGISIALFILGLGFL